MSLRNIVRRFTPAFRRAPGVGPLGRRASTSRRRSLRLESLEARQMLTINYILTGAGADLSISVPSGGGATQAVTIDFDGTNYTFAATSGGPFQAVSDPGNLVSGNGANTISVAAASFSDLYIDLSGGNDTIAFNSDGPSGYPNPMSLSGSSGADTLNVNVAGGAVFQHQVVWDGWDTINLNQDVDVTRGSNTLISGTFNALQVVQGITPPADTAIAINMAENVDIRAHAGGIGFNNSSTTTLTLTGAAGTNVITADGSNTNGDASIQIGGIIATGNANATVQSAGFLFFGGAIDIDGALSITIDADNDETINFSSSNAITAGSVTVIGGSNDSWQPSGTVLATDANAAVVAQGLQLDFGSTLSIPIGGATPGSGFPQYRSANLATLTGTTLSVSLVGGFMPAANSTYRIIDNTSANPITGTFTGLAQGAGITVGASTFTISYTGGDGNDVVLTATAPPPDMTFVISGTTLTVTDTMARNNLLDISFDGTNLVFDDPNAILDTATGGTAGGTVSNGFHRLTLPLASGAGGANLTQINVNSAGGDDTLTIDQGTTTAGRMPLNVAYNGGTGGDDGLAFEGGGTFNTATYNYTGPHSGDVRMDPDGPGGAAERVFAYSEIEPLANAGTATNMIFNLPGTSDDVQLSDLGGTFRLESTNATFEMTDFVAPGAGGSLTINMAAGDDDITVLAVPAGVTTTINGDSGNDTFRPQAAALAFAANGGANTDTLVGRDATTTWNVTGGGSGNVASGPTFATMENLTGGNQVDTFNVSGSHTGNINGGDGNDIFNLSGSAVVTGSLDGGAGATDELNYAAYATPRSIGIDFLGLTDGFTGTDASVLLFTNVNVVTGSSGADSLSNNLVPAATAVWEIDGTNRFLSSGRELAFSAIENLIGSASQDTFDVTSAHAGNLTGNGGNDAFNITAVALTGNIAGNADDDTLTLIGAASVTGSFDGGVGANDAINFAAITGARNVTLTALGGIDGFNGTESAIGGGFANVNSIAGSAATDSLTNSLVPAATATWEIDGTNRFQSGGRDLAFSAIENLNGGSLADTFTVTAAHTGNLTGNGGNDVFNVTGVLVTGNLAGNAGDDTFNFSGAADVTGTIDGGAGGLDTMTLAGTAANVAHTFNNANDGQVNADGRTLDYLGLDPILDNLSAVARVFTFGGVTGDDITLADDGVPLNGISRISSVSSSETVDFANPTGSLTINTGVGVDTVVVNAIDSFGGLPTVTINGGAGDDDITINALPTALGNVVNGDADNDTIRVGILPLGFTANGGGGTDTLVGPSAAATWNVTGGGSGNIVTGPAFATMENLTGRDLADTFNISGSHTGNILGAGGDDLFNFSGAAVVTGTVDGAAGANDRLSYAGYAAARSFGLAALGAVDGFDGTEASITGGFSNINSITGSPLVDALSNNLVPAAAATWEIDGTNRFLAASRELAFAAIENLNGGSLVDIFDVTASHTGNLIGNAGSDAFNIANAVTLTGNMSGGAGLDELNLTGTGMVTGSFDGGAEFDTLAGGNVSNTWTVNAPNAGLMSSVGGGFTNVEILVGGSLADIFNFTGVGAVAGSLDGQGGTDRLNYSGHALASNVTLTALGGIDGFDGTVASIGAGFRNINELVGTTAFVDSLTGRDAASTWNVAVSKTYVSTNTLAFADFETLNGGSAADTFNVAGANIESGEANTLNGNGGTDTFTLVLPSNGGFVAAAGTTLSVNGGAQPAGTRDVVNIDATLDTIARVLEIRYQSPASGDVDILGIGTANPSGVDVNTVEEVNYTGDAGNDDSVSVRGTAGDDDLTVRPLSASAADVLLGGAFTNSVPSGTPGVDGGSTGPDVSLAGLLPTGLAVNGNGGSDGLTVATPSGPQEITVTNVVVAPSMLVETRYTAIGKTLNVVTAAGDDMVMIDLPDVAGGAGAVTPGVDPNGPLPDFVRVLSDGGNDIVKYIDAGPDQDHNTINFADLDPFAPPPAVATETAFQLAATECSLVLAGAGNDVVRNLTLLANAGFSTNSVMDLADGSDTAFGSNNGKKAFGVGEPPHGDVIYGGAGIDTITAGTMGVKFLFADFDVNGVDHPMPGDVLDGSFNTQVNISAGPGDFINNLVGGFFGSGAILNVVTWLKAQWRMGTGIGDAQASKCANWHSMYSGTGLGTVASQAIADLDTFAADAWYDFTAAASGILTASASFAPGENVEIKVFDEHFAPIAWEFSNDGSAVAQTPVVAGAEYYVRVRGLTTDVDLNLAIADPAAAAPVVAAFKLGHSASGDWFSPTVGSGAQLSSVPFIVDEIRVMFDEDVQVSADDLVVSGVNVPNYGVAEFQYDATTTTATWTLATPIVADKIVATLSDDIRDAAGMALDGEWINPFASTATVSSTFPSGDSVPGGSFALRLNVLDGDINGDGVVDLIDVAQTRDAMSLNLAGVSADVTRDGAITVADILHVAHQMFRGAALPAGEPLSTTATSTASAAAPEAPSALVVGVRSETTSAAESNAARPATGVNVSEQSIARSALRRRVALVSTDYAASAVARRRVSAQGVDAAVGAADDAFDVFAVSTRRRLRRS